jgi:hypothetical protein
MAIILRVNVITEKPPTKKKAEIVPPGCLSRRERSVAPKLDQSG